jgi:hypothetical protein
VTVEEQYFAFPKLMGAPAYARPPVAVEPADRPFDPDELPILAEQTPEERGLLGALAPGFDAARSWSPIGVAPWPSDGPADGAYVPRAGAGSAPEDEGLERRSGGGSSGPRPADDASAERAPAARPFTIRGLTDRLHARR